MNEISTGLDALRAFATTKVQLSSPEVSKALAQFTRAAAEMRVSPEVGRALADFARAAEPSKRI